MATPLANIWLHSSHILLENLSLMSSIENVYHPPHDHDANVSIIASIQKFLTAVPYHEAESFTSLSSGSPTIFTRNKFFKPGFMHIIRECINQLDILISVAKPQIGDPKITPLTYKPIFDRFDLTGTAFDNIVLGGKYTNLHKIQKDVRNIISIMEQLYDEVKIFSTCTFMETIVDMHDQMVEDEQQLIAEHQMKENIFKSLQTDLKTYEKNIRETFFKELDDLRMKTARDLNEIAEYANTEVTYVDDWQSSRKEQNLMILQGKEKGHKSVIEYYQKRKYTENIIHDNMRKYYDEAKNDSYNEIDAVMARYDKDQENRENAIYEIRILLEKVQDEKRQLQNIYDKRAKEMEDWIEYKRKKQEKLVRKRLKYRAAAKIQAWWREVMFRKKLGPYRPKKGKKGDKKNKTRKNKK